MRKQHFIDGLLYANNQEFIEGKLDKPVNYDEIIENLRIQFRVPGGKAVKRIPLAIISVLFAGCSLTAIILFIHELTVRQDVGFILFALCYATVLCFIAYGMIVFAFDLLANRTWKIDDAWQQFTEKGQFLNGQVIGTDSESLRGATIRYQFQNAAGKVIKGSYRYNSLPFLQFIKNEPAFNMQVVNPPHPKPEQVKIWYVDDKLHTVL